MIFNIYNSYLRILLVAVGLLAGSAPVTAGELNLLVDADWLRGHLDSHDVIVVDARSRKEYLQGHIPGAVSLPVAATFGPAPRDDLVGNIDQISELFGNAGITREARVVVYDSGIHKDAARLFWVLEVFGHPQAQLLNGGYAGWVAVGNDISTDEYIPLQSEFVPRVDSERLATQFGTLVATRDPRITIVDVRPVAEYQGRESKSARSGHIPSAISIPASKNLVKHDGYTVYRSAEELEDLFSEIDRSKHVVAYCNKGKDAASAYFVLRNLGYDVSAYDGSWFEWGNDPNLPIVVPEN